jgi:hypothetical protein
VHNTRLPIEIWARHHKATDQQACGGVSGMNRKVPVSQPLYLQSRPGMQNVQNRRLVQSTHCPHTCVTVTPVILVIVNIILV